MIYFPLNEMWWAYAAFVAFVLAVIALDLGVFHKQSHEVSTKEATIWTAVWVLLAFFFNLLLYAYCRWKLPSLLPDWEPFRIEELSRELSLQFLTGFVVEKSLAIDNIFIFAVVFSYFSIPKLYQHKVLFWGILGALLFRALFVAMGSVLMKYEAIVIFFGVLLIVTGIKMLSAGREQQTLDKNRLVLWLRKLLPIHPRIDGDAFFVTIGGKRYVTPLFVALIFLEITDLIFAVDSVPAIFSITDEPFIVFTSNLFAILGLRSMYFMLASALDRFSYIKYGLAGVLVFVGLKMVYLNRAFGGKFPISWSLAIIAVLIGSSIAVSLAKSSKSVR